MNSLFCIIGLPIVVSLFFYEPADADEGYKFPFGAGVHYDVQDWTGIESVISRLENNGDAIIYTRTSLVEFVVKSERNEEVYFKFSKNVPVYALDFVMTFLVDFRKDGDNVWSLFYSPSGGFYWVRATSNPVKLAFGEHWLPIKELNVEKWHLFEVMKFIDPYPESIGADTGIEKARINVRGNVEFVLSNPKDGASVVDEFAFEGQRKKSDQDFWFTISKNGKELKDLNLVPTGYKPCIIDEAVDLEMNRRSGSIRRFKRKFESKDEAIQWYRANFVDKKAAEEIVAIIEKVYLTVSEK